MVADMENSLALGVLVEKARSDMANFYDIKVEVMT